MRSLGIDYGRKRLGLALSDEEGVLASPQPVRIRSRSPEGDLRFLASLVEQHQVAELVLGLPTNMDGTEGEMAQEVRAFAATVEKAVGRPIYLFDERWTTCEAERVLVSGNVSRQRRKNLRDSLSAVLILQGYLDRRASAPPNER